MHNNKVSRNFALGLVARLGLGRRLKERDLKRAPYKSKFSFYLGMGKKSRLEKIHGYKDLVDTRGKYFYRFVSLSNPINDPIYLSFSREIFVDKFFKNYKFHTIQTELNIIKRKRGNYE